MINYHINISKHFFYLLFFTCLQCTDRYLDQFGRIIVGFHEILLTPPEQAPFIVRSTACSLLDYQLAYAFDWSVVDKYLVDKNRCSPCLVSYVLCYCCKMVWYGYIRLLRPPENRFSCICPSIDVSAIETYFKNLTSFINALTIII
jgi:hypothetical protein